MRTFVSHKSLLTRLVPLVPAVFHGVPIVQVVANSSVQEGASIPGAAKRSFVSDFGINRAQGAMASQWVASTCDDAAATDQILRALEAIGTRSVVKREVFSHFWWDGKLDDASETRIEVTLDDDGPTLQTVKDAILKNHSDDTPMVINSAIKPEEATCFQVHGCLFSGKLCFWSGTKNGPV